MEKKPIRILIWGGGVYCNLSLLYIREKEKNKELEVIGVVDRCRPENGMIGGYPYCPPSAVPEQDYDCLLILSSRYAKEIREEYLRMPGSDRKKIHIITYPEIGAQQYFQIVEARPTIFSMSCWGGYLYHFLGIECLSPFKNLWVTEEEYMRFLHDPRGYMSLDPVPERMQSAFSQWDKDPYPVLRLGDMYLYCNHSDSMEQAISDWIRRREKINWDFLVAEMHTNNPSREKEFNALDTVHRKICFVPYSTSEPFSFRIPSQTDAFDIEKWVSLVNETAFPWRNPFDIYSVFFGERKKNAFYVPHE